MKGRGSNIGDSLTLSFELVLPTILGAALGYYIDLRFSFAPIAMIVGVFIGAALGFINVVRKFKLDSEKKEKR
jgi:F0F1-type ATP synthase assembly protein I